MAKNFLIITEGAKTEPNILSFVLKKYGFNIIKQDPIRINEDCEPFDMDVTTMDDGKDNIYIAQGPKNRISEFILLVDERSQDVERYFLKLRENFAGIFLIYDVDHTSNEALKIMFDKYQDETSGLLVLSSPCIEILSEPNRIDVLKVDHLSEYKTERKKWVQDNFSDSVEHYIINNFEKLVLEFLSKNCKESGSDNVLDHPEFVLKQINLLNERHFVNKDLQPVVYRYFTTTLYVCLAYILGLTKEINNSEIVAGFFRSHIK